jgi:DNA-binding NarL/FixJ family response regulator
MKNSGDIEVCCKADSAGDNCAERAKTFLGNLTAAERRILASVSLAKTNKEIAAELNISPATVKRHLENILRKLHLRNRVAAAVTGFLAYNCRGDANSACALKKCLSNCAGVSTPPAPADS